jgi:transketolase
VKKMLQKIADTVRALSADAVEHAGSGHAGMPLGCAEIGAYLFAKEMKYNPEEPGWFNRDRLILSAGHGSIWLYSLLHLSGYDLSLEDLKQYRKFNSKTNKCLVGITYFDDEKTK